MMVALIRRHTIGAHGRADHVVARTQPPFYGQPPYMPAELCGGARLQPCVVVWLILPRSHDLSRRAGKRLGLRSGEL